MMTIRTKGIWQLITLLALLSLTGCGGPGGPLPVELTTVPPTAPATLPEIIDALSAYTTEVRITAAFAVPKFGQDAVAAVPALIENLHHWNSDVRESAAFALEKIGPEAHQAVPTLIDVLQNDDTVNVRVAVAEALGQIGNPSAVPTLASILYEAERLGPTPTPLSCERIGGAEVCDYGTDTAKWWRVNIWLTIVSADSIALITGEDFPDAGLRDGYRSNEAGIPLIVIAAREWWEEEGQHQDWSRP